MAIEDLERELYKKDSPAIDKRNAMATKGKLRPRIDPIRSRKGLERFSASNGVGEEEGTAWQEDMKEPMRGVQIRAVDADTFSRENKSRFSVKKILLWGVVVVSLGTIAIVSYLIYQALTLSGVTLEGRFPERILLGTPFDFKVHYSNNSGSVLRGAKITVALPVEFSFVNKDASKRIIEKGIGDVGVGTIGEETFSIIATAGAESSKLVTVGLDYSSSALGSRFHKDAESDVFVGESAASLDLTAPDKVLSGETFEIRIPYKNISSGDFTDVELSLEVPQNFVLKTSSSKPDPDTKPGTAAIWELGDLKAGSSDELIVQGSVTAPPGSFFDIGVALTSSVNGSRYTVAEKSKSIGLSASPLAISMVVNNQTDYVAKAGERLTYSIIYTNNTDVGFRDVIISAKLTGEMFDFTTISTQGGFNSLSNTVTWDASNVPDLKVLSPGASSTVYFQVSLMANYPIKRFNDKNFMLKVDARINSPTVPTLISAEKTESLASLETKISGAVTLQTLLLFKDAASGVLNKGTLPLRVNVPTQFTLHWSIKNYATAVSNLEVRAFLRPGVRATGVMQSNVDTKPEYNDRTGEISWKIPKVEAGQGLLSAPLEAIFQIEAVPPITLVGRYMPLLGDATLEAADLFTGTKLSLSNIPEVTSQFHDDPSLGEGDGKVVQ